MCRWPLDGDIVADQDEGMYIVEMMVGIDTVETAAVVDVVNTLVEGTEDSTSLVGEGGVQWDWSSSKRPYSSVQGPNLDRQTGCVDALVSIAATSSARSRGH